jgi:hypothetical protein
VDWVPAALIGERMMITRGVSYSSNGWTVATRLLYIYLHSAAGRAAVLEDIMPVQLDALAHQSVHIRALEVCVPSRPVPSRCATQHQR